MGNRPRTQEFYNQLLEAYRGAPGNHHRAAAIARCDRMTAKRAWELGWAFPWAPPIKDALSQEQVVVRAARQQAQEEANRVVAVRVAELEAEAVKVIEEANARLEAADMKKREAEEYLRQRVEEAEQKARARYNELLDKAKVDALESQAEEAQLSKMGRKSAQGMMFLSVSFLQNAKLLAERFNKSFSATEFNAKQSLQLGLMLARLTKEANEAARLALENERKRVGDPSEVIGLSVTTQAEDAPLEEIRIQAEAVLEALKEVQPKLSDKVPNADSGAVH